MKIRPWRNDSKKCKKNQSGLVGDAYPLSALKKGTKT